MPDAHTAPAAPAAPERHPTALPTSAAAPGRTAPPTPAAAAAWPGAGGWAAAADRARLVEVLAFAAAGGVLVLYAARGGTFDVVPRAELGIAAWWAVALGWAAGVLPRARPARGGALAVAALVLLAGWTAASLLWTESAERTAGELARVAHHAGLLALALSLLGPRTWRATAAGAVTGALAVCALAVASRLWPAAFPSDRVGASFGAARLSFPLNYWNAVAAWSAMAATAALALSAHATALRARAALLAAVPLALTATYLTYSRAGVGGVAAGTLIAWAASRHRVRFAVHALAAAVGAALVIAVIRAHPAIARAEGAGDPTAVLLALAAAATLCVIVAWSTRRGDRWRVPRRHARPLTVVAASAVLVAAALTLPPALAAFRDRAAAVTLTDGDPTARLGSLSGTRVDVWASALAAFKAEPVHGIGAGTFEFWWSREARDPEFMVDAHSLYLELPAELGLPGLALILAFCGAGWLAAASARRRATSSAEAGAAAACLAGVSVWLLHAGVDWMWESTATVAFALLLLATAAAGRARPSAASRPQPVRRSSAPRPRPTGARPSAASRAAVVLLALAAIAVQAPALVGATQLRASEAAARAGHAAQARAAAAAAARTQPWAASPRVQLGLLAERRGDLAGAERELRLAAAAEPANWRHPFLLARVRAARGDADGALRAYRAARRLRPLGGTAATTAP